MSETYAHLRYMTNEQLKERLAVARSIIATTTSLPSCDYLDPRSSHDKWKEEIDAIIGELNSPTRR